MHFRKKKKILNIKIWGAERNYGGAKRIFLKYVG